MSGLRELYQQVIVDHSRQPRNFGELSNANLCKEGYNPLCGDKLTIFILEKNGLIEKICFQGSGCAISLASASLLTERLQGETCESFEKLFDAFHGLVTKSQDDNNDLLKKLAVFAGVAEFPARVKCATLAWHTVKAALQQDETTVSTE